MKSVLGVGYSLELFGRLAQETGVSICVFCVGGSCYARTISMLFSSNWNVKLSQSLTSVQCWYCHLCVLWRFVVTGQLDVE